MGLPKKLIFICFLLVWADHEKNSTHYNVIGYIQPHHNPSVYKTSRVIGKKLSHRLLMLNLWCSYWSIFIQGCYDALNLLPFGIGLMLSTLITFLGNWGSSENNLMIFTWKKNEWSTVLIQDVYCTSGSRFRVLCLLGFHENSLNFRTVKTYEIEMDLC